MTIPTKNNMNAEQIKNESAKAIEFYNKLKIYFKKDNFGIVNESEEKVLESQITEINKKREQLTELKTRSEQVLKDLTGKKDRMTLKNKKLKESLVKKLNLEVKQ